MIRELLTFLEMTRQKSRKDLGDRDQEFRRHEHRLLLLANNQQKVAVGIDDDLVRWSRLAGRVFDLHHDVEGR